jgi:uncharacterized DUF497 family protein
MGGFHRERSTGRYTVCITGMGRFEWDAAKDRANRRKHGFDFKTAARVIEDPKNDAHGGRVDEEGKQRWHALGMVGGGFLLVVVHAYIEAENGEEIIRIVSAREANQHEGRVYFQ